MENFVSIIICHYSQGDETNPLSNTRKNLLRECIETLEKYTDYPSELIVVDNGGNNDDSNYLLDKVREGTINTYLRNKDNMLYGWAWNQGVKLAQGEYICLMCNDIIVKEKWLSKMMYPVICHSDTKKYPKVVSSPINGKRKYDIGEQEDYYINSWAGSDCMIMKKETFYEVGEYTTYRLAGSVWQENLIKKGYKVFVPKVNLAENHGLKDRLNTHRNIVVKKKLFKGKELDLSFNDVVAFNKGHEI